MQQQLRAAKHFHLKTLVVKIIRDVCNTVDPLGKLTPFLIVFSFS